MAESLALEMRGARQKPPLVYVLHSGNLYGTERMALHTSAGLADQFEPWILAPAGPALDEARSCGLGAQACDSMAALTRAIRSFLSRHKEMAYIATGLVHSALCLAWNNLYRRKVSHVHLVHGGACDRLSYGRKHYLNHFPVSFVAVSGFVRDKLTAYGVDPSQVQVIENFLPVAQLGRPGRSPFAAEAPSRIVVISRLDPEKRVSLLLDALEKSPDLQRLDIHVYGSGWEAQTLRERAARQRLPIVFESFHHDMHSVLVRSDLLVHLCPAEPFGLAIIEATAAGVPVLVPDSGGAALLVEDQVTGFRFPANDAAGLAQRLRQVLSLDSNTLNDIVARARALHETRFSASQQIARYRQILMEDLA